MFVGIAVEVSNEDDNDSLLKMSDLFKFTQAIQSNLEVTLVKSSQQLFQQQSTFSSSNLTKDSIQFRFRFSGLGVENFELASWIAQSNKDLCARSSYNVRLRNLNFQWPRGGELCRGQVKSSDPFNLLLSCFTWMASTRFGVELWSTNKQIMEKILILVAKTQHAHNSFKSLYPLRFVRSIHLLRFEHLCNFFMRGGQRIGESRAWR